MFDDEQQLNNQPPNNSPFGQPKNPFQPPKVDNQLSNNEMQKPVSNDNLAEDIFVDNNPPLANNNFNQNQSVKPIDVREQIINNNFPIAENNNYDPDVFGGRSFPWKKMLPIGLMILAGILLLVVGIFLLNFIFKSRDYDEFRSRETRTVTTTNQDIRTNLENDLSEVNLLTDAEENNNEISEEVIIDDRNRDSDGDGLTDWEEINIYGTDPFNPDTDGDGLTDWAEVMIYKTDPLNPDTDGDGYNDGYEVINNYDPLDPTPGSRLYNVPGLE